MKIYPSIAEALTLGTGRLAVDGVLLIGEHGEYPRNEKGQRKYPRYEFWKEIVRVFENSGRVVPVFNDKHLSWNWEWALEMYETARRMKIPFMAGSSLPVTWRTPQVEMPANARVREALCVAYGGVDGYDIHALETVQCMVERRKGGETGIKSVQVIDGEAVWKAGEEGRWPKRLLAAALSRSDSPNGLSATDGRPQDLLGSGELRKLVKQPAAYMIEHNDGLRTALLMLNGAVSDFTFAAQVRGRGVISTQFFLPPVPNVTYSACLMSKIEEMVVTGRAPYPVERTLIVSGALESCLRSRKAGGAALETPHLAVKYRAPKTRQHA